MAEKWSCDTPAISLKSPGTESQGEVAPKATGTLQELYGTLKLLCLVLHSARGEQ